MTYCPFLLFSGFFSATGIVLQEFLEESVFSHPAPPFENDERALHGVLIFQYPEFLFPADEFHGMPGS